MGDTANLDETKTGAGSASVHTLSHKRETRIISVRKDCDIKPKTENIKYQNVKMNDWIYQYEHKPGLNVFVLMGKKLARRPQMFLDLWQKQLHLASVPMLDGRIGAGN